MGIIRENYRKLTERRLWAYSDIKVKIARDMQDIEDLKREKYLKHSGDIVRITDIGTLRVTLEEVHQIRIAKAQAEVDECRREVERLESLVGSISDEPYANIIPLKFFQRLSEQAIALRLNCDISTVYRHKTKLLGKLAIRLYGVRALDSIGDEIA